MNFGTPVPLLLGIILIIGAVVLFFLDRLRPGYERDYDKVYAVLSLLSGIFLLTQLTMELIPAFQQILMVGMLVSLTIQNIRSRTPNVDRFAQQPAPGGPPRDSYRPRPTGRPSYRPESRQSVRAELEQRDLAPGDRSAYRPNRPMLGGRSDAASDGPPYYKQDDAGYGRESGYGREPGYGQESNYSQESGGYSANADYPEYDRNGYSDGYGTDSYSDAPADSSDPYSSSRYSTRRPDERIRTRRPLRLRDGSDRTRRLKPGDPNGRRGL